MAYARVRAMLTPVRPLLPLMKSRTTSLIAALAATFSACDSQPNEPGVTQDVTVAPDLGDDATSDAAPDAVEPDVTADTATTPDATVPPDTTVGPRPRAARA